MGKVDDVVEAAYNMKQAFKNLVLYQEKSQQYSHIRDDSYESFINFISDNEKELPQFIQIYMRAWKVEFIETESALKAAIEVMNLHIQAFHAARSTYENLESEYRNEKSQKLQEDIEANNKRIMDGSRLQEIMQELRKYPVLPRTKKVPAK